VRTGGTASISASDNNQIPITDAPVYVITQQVGIVVPSPSGGAGSILGRQKIAENTSPIPRDRVFFNYSLFHNTALPGALDVHRYGPGFEKTFWDGATSLEARFPFASTLDSDVTLDPNALATVPEDVEFGNINLIFKAMLWEEDTWAVSAGLQVGLPTAKDVVVSAPVGLLSPNFSGTLVEVNNDAAHLAPFVGAVYADGRLFTQAYVQIDAAARGNRVWVRDLTDAEGDNLLAAGELDDATFLYADWGIGYWMYRNPQATLVTAAAPIFEAHWNQSLETTDVVQSGMFQIGTPAENISVLNLVMGGVLRLRAQSTLTVGYATPVGASADREFDGELRVVFNRYFGSTFGLP
jgi:hypothetical protein